MVNSIEFAVDERVTYWNGETFFRGRIHRLKLDPITKIVQYEIRYKPNASSLGYQTVRATAKDIKESKHFNKGK